MSPFTQHGGIAIVTGAASGYGKGLADALAARGMQVTYADINEAGAVAAAQAAGGHCEGVHADVSTAAACAALVDGVAQRKGRVDVIINAAGYAVGGEATDITPEDWQGIVAVNLMGAVHCSVAAYRHMARQGGGQIVNIASLAGLLPMPMSTPYATTKAGLVNFSHSLRCEGEALGIRVSAVCPSFIDTPIFENARYRSMQSSTLRERVTPLLITVDKAVRMTLAGMDANRATIVFPLHARIFWMLQRLWPVIPNPMTRRLMARARADKRAA